MLDTDYDGRLSRGRSSSTAGEKKAGEARKPQAEDEEAIEANLSWCRRSSWQNKRVGIKIVTTAVLRV